MDKPQPWPPAYSRDCSLGYCSYYCPQWCFFLFPPPPPSSSPSHPHPPLLIAVIAVVSAAFLSVACYIILIRYRRHGAHARASSPPEDPPAGTVPWHASRHDGLDEGLINKIAACRYRAGGGLIVDGTDCSVCLSQFEDGDRVRLLPKCGHPFHLNCIDTWLKSHSSCPICRAGIFPIPPIRANNTVSTIGSEEGTQPRESESGTTSNDIVEIEEGVRVVIRRSLSMDPSIRRRAEAGASSSGWSRAMQAVTSPVRMKRSRSLSSSLPA